MARNRSRRTDSPPRPRLEAACFASGPVKPAGGLPQAGRAPRTHVLGLIALHQTLDGITNRQTPTLKLVDLKTDGEAVAERQHLNPGDDRRVVLPLGTSKALPKEGMPVQGEA